MLVKYSVSEILERAFEYLVDTTPINNFYAGSIARSITETIASEIGETNDPDRSNLYRFMQEVLEQGYVSKATDKYLDMIGTLVNWPRRTEWSVNDEGVEGDYPISDDEYRIEITQQIMNLSRGNEIALRLNLLLIPGVQAVVPEQYVLGTGSFKFTIIEEYGYDNQEILDQAQAVVDEIKGYGIRATVEFPISVRFDIDIKQYFKDGTSAEDMAISTSNVKAAIEKWIASKGLGEGIIYNELVKIIMDASDVIEDFEVVTWNLNESPVMLMNHSIESDERLVVGTIEVA